MQFFRALQLTPLQSRVMTSCKSPPQPNHPYLLPPWKNWTHARHSMSKPLWHNSTSNSHPYHHENYSNQILETNAKAMYKRETTHPAPLLLAFSLKQINNGLKTMETTSS